jgi:hypothetical protein
MQLRWILSSAAFLLLAGIVMMVSEQFLFKGSDSLEPHAVDILDFDSAHQICRSAIAIMNSATSQHRDHCSELTLERVVLLGGSRRVAEVTFLALRLETDKGFTNDSVRIVARVEDFLDNDVAHTRIAVDGFQLAEHPPAGVKDLCVRRLKSSPHFPPPPLSNSSIPSTKASESSPSSLSTHPVAATDTPHMDTPSPPSSPPSEHDPPSLSRVVLIIHLSPSKFDALEETARRWTGPIIAGVYGDPTVCPQFSTLPGHVSIVWVIPMPGDPIYPVNKIRQAAIDSAGGGDFVLTLDVDFVPSTTLYGALMRRIKYLQDNKMSSVFVIAAFESDANVNVPADRAELDSCISSGYAPAFLDKTSKLVLSKSYPPSLQELPLGASA